MSCATLCIRHVRVLCVYRSQFAVAQPGFEGWAKLVTRPGDQKSPSGVQDQNRLLEAVGDETAPPPERFEQLLAHCAWNLCGLVRGNNRHICSYLPVGLIPFPPISLHFDDFRNTGWGLGIEGQVSPCPSSCATPLLRYSSVVNCGGTDVLRSDADPSPVKTPCCLTIMCATAVV